MPENGVLLSSRPHLSDLELSASQDWKRHKPFCKANAKKSSVPSLNASNDTGEDTVRRTTRSEDKASDTFPGRAPGYSIEVPLKHGGTMQLHSKTLGPHMMREFRKVAEDRNGR